MIVYGQNEEEIGKMLSDDPVFASHPDFLALHARIVDERTGNGTYTFFRQGTTVPVVKEAFRETVGLHGAEWRAIVSRPRG
jgi:hypothetical protein